VHDLSIRQREHWFAAYATTLVERDIADLAEVRDVRGLHALVQ